MYWLTSVHLLHSPRRAHSIRIGTLNCYNGDTYKRQMDELSYLLAKPSL
ncbi:unnamed protein product, partial [Rotaria socialis]